MGAKSVIFSRFTSCFTHLIAMHQHMRLFNCTLAALSFWILSKCVMYQDQDFNQESVRKKVIFTIQYTSGPEFKRTGLIWIVYIVLTLIIHKMGVTVVVVVTDLWVLHITNIRWRYCLGSASERQRSTFLPFIPFHSHFDLSFFFLFNVLNVLNIP